MKEKAVVTAAITGSIHTPSMSKHLLIPCPKLEDR